MYLTFTNSLQENKHSKFLNRHSIQGYTLKSYPIYPTPPLGQDVTQGVGK